MIWKIQDRLHDLSRQGWMMGILNITPDSFSDGGEFFSREKAVAHGLQMVAEGAQIIDLGGESTRPGAAPVAAAEEMRRVLPVLAALREKTDVLLSIDTQKPEVAAAALEAGANIINDVAGGSPAMLELVKKSGAGFVCLHMQGNPATMQQQPSYLDVVAEVRAFFAGKLDAAVATGLDPRQIVFDPGIGFGKKLEHNLALLRHLALLRTGGRPILLGVSRKSFLGKIIGSSSLENRLWPTVALTVGCCAGAEIFRVHDVAANLAALRTVEALRG